MTRKLQRVCRISFAIGETFGGKKKAGKIMVVEVHLPTLNSSSEITLTSVKHPLHG